MLTFVFSHTHAPGEASRRLVAAAPGEGIEVRFAPGSDLDGSIVAPSALGPVEAGFRITDSGVHITVTASPKYVPDGLIQAVMEDKLTSALA